MKDEITIRQADESDIAALACLLADFQSDARRYDPHLAEGAEVGNETVARAMLSDCAQRDGVVLIAASEGKTLGFASCALGDDDGVSVRLEWRRAMEINDLYIVPAARRCGLGHRFIDRIAGHARKKDCRRMIVTAYAGNTAADAAYRAMGFGDHLVTLEKVLAD